MTCPPEYIAAALEKAQYKVIEDEYPFFAEVPELEGVWATGRSIEDCRKELIDCKSKSGLWQGYKEAYPSLASMARQ